MNRSKLTPEQMHAFALLLKTLRTRAGLSRAKLAKRANLCEATIKLLESGAYLPTRRVLYRLMSVEVLGLSSESVRELLLISNLVSVQYDVTTQSEEGIDEQGAICVRLTLRLVPLK